MFQGTAAHYALHRPGVPRIAVETILDYAERRRVLLDLGSGTGMVFQALGMHFTDHLIGVEPDEEMIQVAAAGLERAELDAKVTWWNGPAEMAPIEAWPTPDVVTACRAFHWMDQPLVLEALTKSMGRGSALVIMGDGSLWRDDLDWTRELQDLIRSYLGPDRRAGKDKVFVHHNKPYADVLRDAGFADVTVARHQFDREWAPDDVVGYLYSTSFAAQHLFGADAEKFESEALALLHDHSTPAGLVEPASFELVMGRR